MDSFNPPSLAFIKPSAAANNCLNRFNSSGDTLPSLSKRYSAIPAKAPAAVLVPQVQGLRQVGILKSLRVNSQATGGHNSPIHFPANQASLFQSPQHAE